MNGWIKRWAVVGLLLSGWAYAGEPPFRETARVTLSQYSSESEVDEMALSTNRWLGGSGDFSANANWTHGHQPAGDDIGVFDGTSSTSVTSGLNAAGTPFTQLLVKPEYRGNIASPGDPLHIDIGSGPLVWRGSGQGFINGVNGSTMQVVCDVRHSRASQYDLTIGGHGVAAGGGRVSTFAVKRGRVNVIGDVDFVGHVIVQGSHSYLKLNANLAAFSEMYDLYCTGGYVENGRTLAASRVIVVSEGGHVVQIAALASSHKVLVVGGKFEYLPLTAPGTSPLLFILSGLYDQTDERFDQVWGTSIIGIDATVRGGVIRGTGVFPPTLDLRDEYPGAQE